MSSLINRLRKRCIKHKWKIIFNEFLHDEKIAEDKICLNCSKKEGFRKELL